MAILDVPSAAHLQWQIAGDLRALAEPAVLTPARRRAIARHLELAGSTNAGVSTSQVDCEPWVVAAHHAARELIAEPADPDGRDRDTIMWGLVFTLLVLERTEMAGREASGESFDEARRRMDLRAHRQHARQVRRARQWDRPHPRGL